MGNPENVRFEVSERWVAVSPCPTQDEDGYPLQRPDHHRCGFVTSIKVIRKLVHRPGYTLLFRVRKQGERIVLPKEGQVLIAPSDRPSSWSNRKKVDSTPMVVDTHAENAV